MPESTDALLALGDVAFVKAAYLTLLGREADERGLASYLSQVRNGAHKGSIVASLALSDEGCQRAQTLAGLPALLAAHTPRSNTWPRRTARRLRAFIRGSAQEPTERSLRIIDNRMFRLEAALETQAGRSARLRDDLAEITISLNALPPSAWRPAQAHPLHDLSSGCACSSTFKAARTAAEPAATPAGEAAEAATDPGRS